MPEIFAQFSTAWKTSCAAGAVPRPALSSVVELMTNVWPEPSTDVAVCVPWPLSTSRAPSLTTLEKQPPAAPGQLKIPVTRLDGISAKPFDVEPLPRPVSATATVWVEPSNPFALAAADPMIAPPPYSL